MTLKANDSTHLFLEIAGCPAGLLKDRAYIRKFLNEMPGKMGMKVLLPAKVVQCDAEDQIDSGLSGTVIISESHLSIHAFPNRGHAFIDLFSCKDFDTIQARDFIISYFEAKVSVDETAARGSLLDWYKNAV